MSGSRRLVGPVGLTLGAVAALAVAPWLGPLLEADTAGFVILQLRLPRAVLGALIGMALGIVGAVFQVLFDNPLATPSTVGTTAGASLGALAVLVLWPGGPIAGLPLVAIGAFLGASLVTGGIVSLSASRRLSMAELLLLGIAISLGASAVTMGLQVRADAAATFRAVRWSLGSLATVGWWVPAGLALPVLLGVGVLHLQLRAFDAVAAGAEQAGSQGVPLGRLRAVGLGVGSFLVGLAVAAVGPIAFVGLLVPHLVRLVVGGAPRRLLPLSAVVGAGLLPLADGLARVIVPGRELPVGVLTAAIGAPTLVILLVGRARGRR